MNHLIKECPHDGGRWLCPTCMDLNYEIANKLSAGMPALSGVSEYQIDYAVYTRWKAVDKHGDAIADLVNNEIDAAWWLDNKAALLRGSLTGKLGQLLERSRLQQSDPLQAWRRGLQEALDAAKATLVKERRAAEAEMKRSLRRHEQRVEECQAALLEFSDTLPAQVPDE